MPEHAADCARCNSASAQSSTCDCGFEIAKKNVLAMNKPIPADDVVYGLRRLADAIEAGTSVRWPITTCLVILGHTDQKRINTDIIEHRSHIESFGFGPRCDDLTVTGLLARASQKR